LSELRNFFRSCPNCGRRFEIRLLSKKLIGDKIVTTNFERPRGFVAMRSLTSPIMLEENVPITIDEQEFQYSYKCKHCDHEWFEVVKKEENLS
jgi:transcription elongation factor Elf1